jgi:hypothetical protein
VLNRPVVDNLGGHLTSDGAGVDGAGVTFPGDLDPRDEPLHDDQVELCDPMAELRMPRDEFLEALLQIGEAILASHESDARLDAANAGKRGRGSPAEWYQSRARSMDSATGTAAR